LVLLAPDGSVLISDDDGGINLDSVIRRYTLTETGSYTLVLGQAGAWGTGEVELAVYQDGEITSSNPGNPNVAFSFAAYYLYVGETAEVFTTGRDNLNLRSGPSTSYEIVDSLERGELVTLLEGPYKEAGAYSWWRIRTSDGIEGYAVERVETEQTLQMALLTGEEALVTSAPDLLNVRGEPTRSSSIVFQLEDGDIVTLLDEAPVIADGLRWWHLRDAEGREGWAVDRIGIERSLAPLREFPTS
jgi:SH3-like domain-containing protein